MEDFSSCDFVLRALFPALFFLLIILRTSVVIHGCVGFDLDNFEGTDFSMAFNRMFLKKQGIKHAKQNHRETKTDIENLNCLHNEQQGKLTTTM
jgi:hypothetical protein